MPDEPMLLWSGALIPADEPEREYAPHELEAMEYLLRIFDAMAEIADAMEEKEGETIQ